MINGTHHTSINTADIDRAMDFYSGLLGFEERWGDTFEQGLVAIDEIVGIEDAALAVRLLWTGNSYLELISFSRPPSMDKGARQPNDIGITHVCFDVRGLDAEYRRLAEAGVKFKSQPVDILGVKTVYGQDPDGNILEFQELIDQHDIAL